MIGAGITLTTAVMDKRVLFSTKWYEMRVHLGVLNYAQDHKWDIISSHHMPESAFDIPALDGQIVEVGPNDRRRLRLTEEFKGPVVALEDFGDGLDVPRVHTDNVAVGRIAAEHFIDRGFKRFATVSRANYTYVDDRLKGFHDSIEKLDDAECLDMKLNNFWQQQLTDTARESKDSTVETLLSLQRPVAIFCVDDDDAAGLLRILEDKSIATPEEIAIVGVNDDPLICPFTPVQISSIDPGFEDIGYKAAELLDQMMQGKKVPNKTYLVQPKGLVVRRSSDIRAIEDVDVARAIRFIWDHSENWKSVTDIANHVNLPIRTLQWRFNKAMGYSLQSEITRSRIELIKERLVHTDKSVKQIAMEMDFSSVQYLIRLFSKETGLSPLKYRRENQILAK